MPKIQLQLGFFRITIQGLVGFNRIHPAVTGVGAPLFHAAAMFVQHRDGFFRREGGAEKVPEMTSVTGDNKPGALPQTPRL